MKKYRAIKRPSPFPNKMRLVIEGITQVNKRRMCGYAHIQSKVQKEENGETKKEEKEPLSCVHKLFYC